MQAEAAASVERAKEELRRYRVRHEMLLRGKEAEIKQVCVCMYMWVVW